MTEGALSPAVFTWEWQSTISALPFGPMRRGLAFVR